MENAAEVGTELTATDVGPARGRGVVGTATGATDSNDACRELLAGRDRVASPRPGTPLVRDLKQNRIRSRELFASYWSLLPNLRSRAARHQQTRSHPQNDPNKDC
jgi:hypothetical protein